MRYITCLILLGTVTQSFAASSRAPKGWGRKGRTFDVVQGRLKEGGKIREAGTSATPIEVKEGDKEFVVTKIGKAVVLYERDPNGEVLSTTYRLTQRRSRAGGGINAYLRTEDPVYRQERTAYLKNKLGTFVGGKGRAVLALSSRGQLESIRLSEKVDFDFDLLGSSDRMQIDYAATFTPKR